MAAPLEHLLRPVGEPMHPVVAAMLGAPKSLERVLIVHPDDQTIVEPAVAGVPHLTVHVTALATPGKVLCISPSELKVWS